MRPAVLGGALLWICCVAAAPALAAGHGHGGGHGSGGHSGGGHVSAGGHATGGHATGHGQGTATPRTPSTPTPDRGDPHGNQPPVGTAVPRPSVPRTPSVGAVAPTTPTGPTVIPPVIPPLPYGVPYYGLPFGVIGLRFYNYPFSSYTTYTGFPYLGRSWGTGAGASALMLYGSGVLDYAPDTTAIAPSPFDGTGPMGQLRLKVEPKEAQVCVDGYYAGLVDDFDGHFQHLDLTVGRHHIEIRGVPGYEPLVFDVIIQAHHTIEYRGILPRSAQ